MRQRRIINGSSYAGGADGVTNVSAVVVVGNDGLNSSGTGVTSAVGGEMDVHTDNVTTAAITTVGLVDHVIIPSTNWSSWAYLVPQIGGIRSIQLDCRQSGEHS